MRKICDLIKQGKVLVSDGAWGTILQQKGLRVGDCPEMWNINHHDDVLDIARSYIDAGADMIKTNSFGANRYKLLNYGLEKRVCEINHEASVISRHAAGNDKFVIASIGPTGKILMMGDVTEEGMYSAFKEQAQALESGGADALIIETMTDLAETCIAVRAAKENTKCEIICTMTFDKTLNGDYRTMMGVAPGEMVQQLVDAGADIIGANCGKGSYDMIGIAKEIRSLHNDIPIIIHANAGMPVYCEGKTVYPESPEEMAANTEGLIKAGVNIIGGCCGTTPDHIRMIAEKVRGIINT